MVRLCARCTLNVARACFSSMYLCVVFIAAVAAATAIAVYYRWFSCVRARARAASSVCVCVLGFFAFRARFVLFVLVMFLSTRI